MAGRKRQRTLFLDQFKTMYDKFGLMPHRVIVKEVVGFFYSLNENERFDVNGILFWKVKLGDKEVTLRVEGKVNSTNHPDRFTQENYRVEFFNPA